jgi:hypothetical protein
MFAQNRVLMQQFECPEQRKRSVSDTSHRRYAMNLRLLPGSAVLAGALTMFQGALAAQAPLAAPPGSPESADKAALMDLTGYWVSVVDQDWRFRMMTPPKGDYAQVPLNAAARKIADQFNPAQYGGANYQTSGIIDCRLHITWASPNELKIETDWGQQTRLLHFTPGHPYGDMEQALRTGEAGASHGPASLQGYSAAVWEHPTGTTPAPFREGR